MITTKPKTCSKCGLFWSTERELIDKIIESEKGFIKSLMLGCVRNGLSLQKSCTLVQDNVGQTYSPQYLHELYTEALEGLPVEAFTVDMAVKYPGIIAELYPKAVIQWCIFHLDKLIWKELTDECGKNPPLRHIYNAYLLFDVFFDHTTELRKLEELLAQFQRLRTGDPKRDQEIEKGLRKEFRRFTKELKKQRRRSDQNVPRRTLEQSVDIFATLKHQVALFPKKLQHRIALIEKNWDRFTLFQRDSRVQPTNNGMEQYFAATLAKTDKKDFRSAGAITRELHACQAE